MDAKNEAKIRAIYLLMGAFLTGTFAGAVIRLI